MAQVTLEDVTKVYDPRGERIVAVEDLNLEIEDGEFLVLVGPSGCGKSTTLRMVGGLEDISEGTISIGGRIVNDDAPKDRDIAMVFQNYALYPHMTVRENIGFGLKYSSDLSKSEIAERVEEVAEMMDIEELLEDTPAELSGGQQQRVALGRSIVREPAVFLFDEPLSNLDAKLRTHMRTEITRLQRDLDVTSIYVTHDQAEAMTMADRIAVMNHGNLQQVGSPNEVYDHPANQFVAGFIGSPRMNFIEATVTNTESPKLLDTAKGGDQLTYELNELIVERTDLDPETSVTVGIRPEDLQVTDERDIDTGHTIRAIVDVVEPMGSDNFLTIRLGDENWVARADPTFHPSPGEEVIVTFDPSDLHLFDSNGQTLKSKGTGPDAFHDFGVTAPKM
ncbi:ABC transporter ATP-binding protein [Natronococcus occultus]|uniref:ABC-type D-xylose/L-arabinose transporter n=1 Tax=Natronococcus occultus SP4 TaxID=694430 RepID=L0JVN0_9EURY|nr:sn-glycerol-3-phosphate ABC transporter ATP-binding protein UgpC [Natronococcus occultus]AGB37092.1 carbohydrate ABC transporter ATP-binding protein, CUT1 family [Natronococcus occultus SP4]